MLVRFESEAVVKMSKCDLTTLGYQSLNKVQIDETKKYEGGRIF